MKAEAKAKEVNVEPLEKEAYARKYFTIRFLDGEVMDVKLLQAGQYHLLVEAESGLLLVPKHAVKYIVLESYGELEDGEAEPDFGLVQARGS